MCRAVSGCAALRRDGGGGAGEQRLLGPAGDQEAAAERGGAEPRARPAAQRQVVRAAAAPAPPAAPPAGLALAGLCLSSQGLRAGLRLGPAAAGRAAAAPRAHGGTAWAGEARPRVAPRPVRSPRPLPFGKRAPAGGVVWPEPGLRSRV